MRGGSSRKSSVGVRTERTIQLCMGSVMPSLRALKRGMTKMCWGLAGGPAQTRAR